LRAAAATVIATRLGEGISMRALQISMVALLATACGTDAEEVVVDGPLEPAPPEGGQQLATAEYTLQPGEERYMCYQFYSPDDEVAITHLDQISVPGVHHFALFQAFGRNEPDEPHECDTLIKLRGFRSGSAALAVTT
jgi:hypothetical protein